MALDMNKRAEMTEWEIEVWERANSAMASLLEAANAMGSSRAIIDGMMDAWRREHRTLQQSVVRMFVAFLSEWAGMIEKEPMAWVDLRNEAAAAFATQLRSDAPAFPMY